MELLLLRTDYVPENTRCLHLYLLAHPLFPLHYSEKKKLGSERP